MNFSKKFLPEANLAGREGDPEERQFF